jgi:ATP-dependent Clp protease adapter protein ClpS
MEKRVMMVLNDDYVNEEIYEDIFEQYFDVSEEMKLGGEENETESK